MDRPKKILRKSYWGTPSPNEASVVILGEPEEVRIQAGGANFISVKEDQISMSGGVPSQINIQGLSHSFKYAGMIQDLPFPLTLLPVTPVTPFPKQIIVPPFLDSIDILRQTASIASSLIGL